LGRADGQARQADIGSRRLSPNTHSEREEGAKEGESGTRCQCHAATCVCARACARHAPLPPPRVALGPHRDWQGDVRVRSDAANRGCVILHCGPREERAIAAIRRHAEARAAQEGRAVGPRCTAGRAPAQRGQAVQRRRVAAQLRANTGRRRRRGRHRHNLDHIGYYASSHTERDTHTHRHTYTHTHVCVSATHTHT
jgi:hypothetical protein